MLEYKQKAKNIKFSPVRTVIYITVFHLAILGENNQKTTQSNEFFKS